jgi:hypothetical protein
MRNLEFEVCAPSAAEGGSLGVTFPSASARNPQLITRSYKLTEMADKKEKVPLFKSWTQWYVFVILFLVVLIILFYLFTKAFS